MGIIIMKIMPKKSLKILVVEDDTFLSSMYSTKFNLEGYTVAVANKGEDGLKMAESEKPDVILLDILLPGIDGFTVLKKLKKTDSVKNIPVIMLTNLGQKDDVRKGFELGAAGYLIKAHYMPSEVVEKVKEVLTAVNAK